MKTLGRLATFAAVLSTLVASPPLRPLFGTDTLPTSQDECTNEGWRRFGVFKDQGDCVSFVATGGNNPPALGPAPQSLFAPPVHYGAGSGSELALGDFDGDTDTDVVVYDGGVSNDVSLLLNKGDGTFAVR
jgi:hypothetical protein